jgi:hypothetical protein
MEIKPIVRDVHGLIQGINYIITDEGQRVDWRKMVKPEYLVPNKFSFEKDGKAVPTSIEGLEDKDLLILLGGIKELVKLRGFLTINQAITAPSRELVSCACHITWLPNFETEGKTLVSAGTADATIENTSGFGKKFLTTIAENRAFVRCVRNFLGIKVLGQDEIAPQGEQVTEEQPQKPVEVSPAGLLVQLMEHKGVSFESVKNKLITEKFKDAEKFNSPNDIPANKILELIGRLKNKK